MREKGEEGKVGERGRVRWTGGKVGERVGRNRREGGKVGERVGRNRREGGKVGESGGGLVGAVAVGRKAGWQEGAVAVGRREELASEEGGSSGGWKVGERGQQRWTGGKVAYRAWVWGGAKGPKKSDCAAPGLLGEGGSGRKFGFLRCGGDG